MSLNPTTRAIYVSEPDETFIIAIRKDLVAWVDGQKAMSFDEVKGNIRLLSKILQEVAL